MTTKTLKAQQAIQGQFLTNYPTYHVMADCGTVCQDCLEADAALVEEATANPGTDSQWQYADTDVNWEDPDLYCDHCGHRIPSAYADDE